MSSSFYPVMPLNRPRIAPVSCFWRMRRTPGKPFPMPKRSAIVAPGVPFCSQRSLDAECVKRFERPQQVRY
jgi:hypothetical protein